MWSRDEVFQRNMRALCIADVHGLFFREEN
jgi:hypothetical protein